jgi:hypothetical protein
MPPRSHWLCVALLACDRRAPCDPASCGLTDEAAQPVDEATWGAFGALLDAYRRGPQPVDDHALGMCLNADCSVARPPLAGVLPPGVWRLRAEFLLPELGRETWHFELHELCEVVRYEGARKAGTRDDTQVLTLDVQAVPGQTGGQAAWLTRTSPDPEGDRLCGWRLTATAGPRAVSWEGAYQIPGVGRPVPANWGPSAEEDPQPPPPSPDAPSSEPQADGPTSTAVLKVMDGKPEDAPRNPSSILPSVPEADPNPVPTTVKPPQTAPKVPVRPATAPRPRGEERQSTP